MDNGYSQTDLDFETTDGSVSRLIMEIRSGDNEAARLIWGRYSDRLLGYSRQFVRRNGESTIADHEDIVVSTFASIFRRLSDGRLPSLVNRDGLWKLLLSAARNKATDQWRHDHRLRRRPVASLPASASASPFHQVEGADLLAHLLERLPSDEYRRICVLRLDGFTNREIANTLEYSVATVERRLSVIRQCWSREL